MKKVFYWISMIYGIVVTLFLLVVFTPKFVGLFIEHGINTVADILKSFVHWYDNPTAFFFTYLIGYVLIWWKPLWGSIIIITGTLLFFIFNTGNIFNLIFGLPVILVAVFYILYWNYKRKA